MSTVDKDLKLSQLHYFVLLHVRSILNGLGQLSRTPWASIAIFVVIGVALALPMGLFVTLDNLNAVTQDLKSTGKINLYVKPGTAQSDLDQLEKVIQRNHDVAQVNYISPKEGMKDFLKGAGFANTADDLNDNPLPGVLVVTPAPTLTKAYQVQNLYNQLSELPNIEQSQVDLAWLQRLKAILAIGHRLSVLLMILFFVAVVFVVGNTISLTTKAYQHEIRVIKLLGGTDSFIRLPFLYSGILYGLVGAIIAFFIIDLAIGLLRSSVSHLTALYHSDFSLAGLNNSHAIMLLVCGVVLGFVGAWFAVGKQLKSVDVKS